MGLGTRYPDEVREKFLLYQLAIKHPSEHLFGPPGAERRVPLELQLMHMDSHNKQLIVSVGLD